MHIGLNMNRRISIIAAVLACAVCAAAAALLLMSQQGATAEETMPEGAHHSVVLYDSGFEPKELTIKKGDVVEWSSVRAYPFWPASDQHPTHSQYRAFDPLQPVPQDQTWSFQFTRVGQWDYHDHLNSTLQGTIIVTE